MSQAKNQAHVVAERRKARGWSQEELSARSGLPRSSVSAIEAGRLTPSVTAALMLARTLECSVEELFGKGEAGSGSTILWAWESHASSGRYWEAEVGGMRVLYPVEMLPGSSWTHDGLFRDGVLHARGLEEPGRTLVMAGCDPAAGLMAAEYAAASDFRMLTFSRGGSVALELLKKGVVHVAALHRSTEECPDRNEQTARERLGGGYRLLRCAEWQEGVALPGSHGARSLKSCVDDVRHWALREPGSAARECLDSLVNRPLHGKRFLLSHQAVAEAVRGGWAEAGVCVQISAEEAGLRFLPIRNESLDLCFSVAMEHDPRLRALIRLLRSRVHRQLIDELPGYNARHTGELSSI
jgi:molybdate-binding protein/transcriptional regulator with XRE-family HTH domain